MKNSKKFAILILAAILIFFAGFKYNSYINKPDMIVETNGEADKTISSKKEGFKVDINNIDDILSPASELITSKYYYKDAQSYENYKQFFGVKLPFTTDKIVFTFEGKISVGFDLSAIKYKIDNENKNITVFLPEISVLSNEIFADTFEYPFVSDSVLNQTGMPDYTKLIDTLKKEKSKDVLSDKELLNACTENAKNIISSLFANSELTKNYTINFETTKDYDKIPSESSQNSNSQENSTSKNN